MTNLPPPATTLIIRLVHDDVLVSSDDDVPIISPKKKGRKKGCNANVLSLQPGGTGGRADISKRRKD